MLCLFSLRVHALYVVDVRGNRYVWLVAVDQHTDYTVIAPCPSHEGQAVARRFSNTGLGGQDLLTCWCATESDSWELLRFSRKLSVSGTQVQTTAAYSPWQKGRVEQRIATIKEVSGKMILQHQVAGRSAMSVVSNEVAHPLKQRAGRLGILPSYTSFWPANEGLMEYGEVVPHPKVVDEGDELARLFTTIFDKIITVLTRYRPIVLELI